MTKNYTQKVACNLSLEIIIKNSLEEIEIKRGISKSAIVTELIESKYPEIVKKLRQGNVRRVILP